jgi:ferrous iron transport protein B
MMYYPRYKSPNYERNLNAAAVQLEQSVKSNVYQPIMASGAIAATVEFIGNYDSEKPSEDKLRNDFAVELADFKAGKAIKNTLAAEAYLKYEQTVRDIENDHQEKQLKNSFAGRIGSFLTPVSRLAGFQWRENIALIGGFAAKEVVLGTMGTAYSMGEISEDNSESLSQYLAQDKNWNRLRAFVLLIFVMSYAPCFVTIAAIKKETGKWRWAIFSTVYSTLLAFVVSVIVYQVGLLFTGG